MNNFKFEHIVRFAEVDAAAIVFYPRYFEMINAVVEDWFAGPLNYSFAQMHLGGKAGVPTVEINCKFLASSRLGDQLVFELGVLELGNSHIKLQIDATCDRQERLQAILSIVYIKSHSGEMSSQPIPPDIRKKMQNFMLPSNDRTK